MTRKLKTKLRQLHRTAAPIMVLPLLLTVITGMVFQVIYLNGKAGSFHWLIDIHKGNFGPLHLEKIYPVLNGLGTLVLLATGISMWLENRIRNNRTA